jgi:hypothetical protein
LPSTAKKHEKALLRPLLGGITTLLSGECAFSVLVSLNCGQMTHFQQTLIEAFFWKLEMVL